MKESFLIEDRYLRSPNDVLRIALAWHENGKEIALATVIGTWGSSPRPIGSNLVIAKNGEFEGSVSGGCVEGAVISAAKEVIEKHNLHFKFNTVEELYLDYQPIKSTY